MRTLSNQFIKLLYESVVIRGIIAIMLLSTICYQAISGIEINRELLALTTLVLGFYFGSLNNQIRAQKVDK